MTLVFYLIELIGKLGRRGKAEREGTTIDNRDKDNFSDSSGV